MNDPQTFTIAHQAQRDADEQFASHMARLYGPETPKAPTLSEFGRTVLVLLTVALIVVVAAWLNQGIPIEIISVEVARGPE